MKIVWNIIGVLVLLAGAIWFMQGVGVLPGSSLMSGQTRWAVYGGLAVLLGAGLLVYVNRRRAH
jgi:LPXTG-motif cell wall-anchored protein